MNIISRLVKYKAWQWVKSGGDYQFVIFKLDPNNILRKIENLILA